MIEIYKHQFKDLSTIIAQIKNRNYKFIIYMDDLSFEEFEIEYKFLKAVIEGGVETKPDNVLIYATSNRRHQIKETWKDREDMEHSEDLHRSDTMEEKLSLVNRFGLSIYYAKTRRSATRRTASRCAAADFPAVLPSSLRITCSRSNKNTYRVRSPGMETCRGLFCLTGNSEGTSC